MVLAARFSSLSTQPNTSLTNARLSWDEHGLPHSVDYGDIYYSRADALGESTYVFIEGNALPARFAGLQQPSFVIGELGFGAGLNFLNACKYWCELAPAGATLHYMACELHPFTVADLQKVSSLFASLAPYLDRLLSVYPDHTAGVHQLVLRQPQHRVCLTLLFGDAQSLLAQIGQQVPFTVDAWFLDGFSPKHNPALWQQGLMQRVAQLSHAGTTLSSYSAASDFRHSLSAAGFVCHKQKGFAHKREMLTAVLAGAPTGVGKNSRSVCIVGGGLSGCSTAYALAETGWQVTLLEQADSLATLGSGNLQAVLHCKPGTADSIDNDFNLHAYLFAQRHYRSLQSLGLNWQQCGMLHVGTDAAQLKRFERIHQSGRFNERILRQVDASAASELAGVTLAHPCLYFPLSGWLSPAALCRFYCGHPNISVITQAKATALQQKADMTWQIEVAGSTSVEADAVVLCNAAEVYDFSQCRRLPLISNRGQVDVYASSAATMVRTILCGQGYLTPASNGLQSLGGSYYVEATTTEHNRQTHLTLLSRMDQSLAAELATQRPLQQRVGQRCQTPDRMPLVGLVCPDLAGLYINAAHGSNGLARTPISAALLASQMNSSPPPLTDAFYELLNPARFS